MFTVSLLIYFLHYPSIHARGGYLLLPIDFVWNLSTWEKKKSSQDGFKH